MVIAHLCWLTWDVWLCHFVGYSLSWNVFRISSELFLCGYYCEFQHCLGQDKKSFQKTVECGNHPVLIINASRCTWFGPTFGMLYLLVKTVTQCIFQEIQFNFAVIFLELLPLTHFWGHLGVIAFKFLQYWLNVWHMLMLNWMLVFFIVWFIL